MIYINNAEANKNELELLKTYAQSKMFKILAKVVNGNTYYTIQKRK